MGLQEYRRKRDFSLTSEPEGGGERKSVRKAARFVIQKHEATRLHFDFRLEMGGALVSWAVPKGMPMLKGEKRLAIKTEDHPISYIDFEGKIPKGQYGGGTVQVWDCGTYVPLSKAPRKELAGGKLHVILHGTKLSGEWYLVRLREEEQWLIIRGGEDHPELSARIAARSVLSGKTLAQLEKAGAANNPPADRVASRAENPTGGLAKKTPFRVRPTPSHVEIIEPMKARSVDQVPEGDWFYEVKFDGYRAVAYKNGKAVGIFSRTHHDLLPKFPDIAEGLEALRAEEAVVDGEIVALDEKGRTSFQLLQACELGQERPPLCYYAFDLLSLKGKSMVGLPLEKRREALQKILPKKSNIVRFSPSLGGEAAPLLEKFRELGLEGLIGKRAGSSYEPGRRSGAWIKLKLVRGQEFVIGGCTEPTGSRRHLGALLVGVYEHGKLTYSGKVGTGFTEAVLGDLDARLKPLARASCPFVDLPEERTGRYGQGITASVMRKCRWFTPRLVCHVKFTEWTKEGRLRHPVYLGLREDRTALTLIREPGGLNP